MKNEKKVNFSKRHDILICDIFFSFKKWFRSHFFWKFQNAENSTFQNNTQKLIKSQIIKMRYPPHWSKKIFEVKKISKKKIHLGTHFFLGKFEKVGNRKSAIKPINNIKSQIFEKVCPRDWSEKFFEVKKISIKV